MEIVIIGSGNTATILGQHIRASGHQIKQVYGRNPGHASRLAAQLEAHAISDFKDLDTEADIYIIAVSDNAVEAVARQLHVGRGVLLHTAGSVPMDVLGVSCSQFGVLYPLQSMRKETSYIPEMPLLIDANNEATFKIVRRFASTLSAQVVKANDAYRRKLHLAAVVVNNFVNHLFLLTEAYCRNEQIDFKLLLPLIRETATRLDHFAPDQVQTGPALRNDTATIERHMLLLREYPQLSAIYRFFSESIAKSRP